MSVLRLNLLAVAFVSVLGANTLLLAVAPDATAAERPSATDIIKALKPKPVTRSLASPPSRAGDQRFIDSLRGRTRSLSAGERQKVADIVKEKPSIDLEVYFDFNSAAITAQAMPDLNNLGKALTSPDLKGSVFLIGGHTDGKGTDIYNQLLSERRAETVKRFLTQKFGINAANLVTAGYGKEQLKNQADPFAGENRRVQIGNLEAKQQAGR
jgi:outer membrane protein OmpA-like peptidoglycan-associated protein